MRYYFAPMEGLTDSVFRRVHHKYFPGIHRYYMPFISPTVHRNLTHKEDRELPVADSVPFCAVPQILTKIPEDFLWAASVCADRGYEEVNLNLGCPSGTVTAKGKGSGMLTDPDQLDRFLDAVFSRAPLPISVKTRIGFTSPAEFPAILEVYNRYPIQELTIHPRVRKQFYEGSVDLEMFRYAAQSSCNPLCYNGDLNSPKEIASIAAEFPQLESIMIGRGLIRDPGMLSPGGTDVQTLEAYHNALLEEYLHLFGGGRNAMFRMKEHWHLLQQRFDGCEKLYKALRKTTDLSEFQSISTQIFHSLPLKQD